MQVQGEAVRRGIDARAADRLLRLEQLVAAAAGRASVGVDGDGCRGVRVVADRGAHVHAGTDAGVVVPSQDDAQAMLLKIGLDQQRDLEVERVLGVSVVAVGAGRVAGLLLAEALRNQLVYLGRVRLVAAVVAGIDDDHLAGGADGVRPRCHGR